MQMRSWFQRALLVVTITACASRQSREQPAQAPPGQPPSAQPGGGSGCPMMMNAGTRITTTDTSDGVAIAFAATRDVAGLRARVRQMAAMHNRMAEMDAGMQKGGGMQKAGGMHESGGMHMVPSRASVEDLPDGARLVLVPVDPSQLANLRQEARMHGQMMQRGECPMMASPERGADHKHPGGA